jgi:HEAT repeat protein
MTRFIVTLLALVWAVGPSSAVGQVVTFEATVADLSDPDPAVRLQALRLLSAARYPEAAEPMATLLVDQETAIQLEAIAAELNLFLVEPVPTRRRVALVFEQWGGASARDLFGQGPLALGARLVPDAVFNGLRSAIADADRRVSMEAIYAIGVLAPAAASRSWFSNVSSALVELLNHPRSEFQVASLRTIGRLFGASVMARPADSVVGDAVVEALNHRDRDVRIAAFEALGALRDDGALEVLTERFAADRRGAEADAAFASLAAIGHSSSAEIFLEELLADAIGRKRLAIEGLARSGPTDMAPIEAAVARERDRALDLAADYAAARLQDRPLDPIVGALMQQRLQAQAFGYLIELVGARFQDFGVYANDPDPMVRLRLAEAVALSGTPDALPLVQKLERDPEPSVAAAATRAITWLQARR